MQEFSVSVLDTRAYMLNHVKSSVEQSCGANLLDNSFSAILHQDKTASLALAVGDNIGGVVGRQWTKACAECLAIGYKNVYLTKAFGNKTDFLHQLLVGALCVLDCTDDVACLQQTLGKLVREKPNCLPKQLNLDGCCIFRMQQLHKKWAEVAKLVNENSLLLADKTIMLEFLQYVLQTSNTKVSTLSVELDDANNFNLYATNNKLTRPLPLLSPTANVEISALVNVLALKPQKVKLYYSAPPGDDFCWFVNNLFNAQWSKV